MELKERSFKSSFTLTILFGVSLILLIAGAISLFESDIPFLGFVGIIFIVLVLVWFPYSSLLYRKIKKKQNKIN